MKFRDQAVCISISPPLFIKLYLINSKATIWRPYLIYDNIETNEQIKNTEKKDLVKIDHGKEFSFRYDDQVVQEIKKLLINLKSI